ncbi:hypothetical protein J4211_00440 [Candidatus Woesearchaeota archaeon]|nr:hypothetical protein [Candidatus Woesearchaeota archaeon]
MWPFSRHLTLNDYLADLRILINRADEELDKVYRTHNPAELNSLLAALDEVDEKGLHSLEKEGASAGFLNVFREIKQGVVEVRVDIENGDFARAHQLIDRLKNLMNSAILQSDQKIISERLISDVLTITIEQAQKNGWLFRGLSDMEYQRCEQGLPLFAKNPNASTPLIQHILGTAEDQFISFTTMVSAAARFGKILVVKKAQLKGNLLDASQIERKIAGDTQAKRLVLKNTEFILEPGSGQPAEIPVEAFVFVGVG